MWRILLIPVLLLLAGYGGLVAYGAQNYRSTLRRRFEGGGDYYPYFVKEHPAWKRREISFLNNRGQKLRGFLFSYEKCPPRALLVLYHGYGMSLDDYLPECEYFSRRGYLVLAFDGSGTGHSEGILYGLPQHILDLKSCLDFVKEDPELSWLPLLLYGHSWGGYGVDCVGVLGDWNIRGIVSASAFATSTAALVEHVKRHYSFLSGPLVRGLRMEERRSYGKLADVTAMDGLKKQNCPVLITQSDDDRIIRYSDNYQVLEKAFSGNPRFTFLPLSGKNHNITTPTEVDAQKRKLLKVLTGDNPPQEAIDEIHRLKLYVDYELLERFGDFLDGCLEQE
ncbi:MAG: alpha/beta hydrolase [Oscillospiraceae bacterium]|nr:alpha/beta hydrolase [Oscillospiraceae bacterium]